MRFRLEHSLDQTRILGIAVVFDEKDIPDLRRMLDLLDRGGIQPAPKVYEPLYRQEGVPPEAMYAHKPGAASSVAPVVPEEAETPARAILRQLQEAKETTSGRAVRTTEEDRRNAAGWEGGPSPDERAEYAIPADVGREREAVPPADRPGKPEPMARRRAADPDVPF